MSVEIIPEATTRESWATKPGAPSDAVPTDIRTAARDRLTQRVRIFENLDETNGRRRELANEITGRALDALTDELYASRGIPVSDHLSIIDALTRVAADADAQPRQRASQQIADWLKATPGSSIDDRGLVAANRLLAVLDDAPPIIDVMKWMDLPRNGHPTSEMVGQLRAAVDVALTTKSAQDIKDVCKAITMIADATPRGWINEKSDGKLQQSATFDSPVRKCLIHEARRIYDWYVPQRQFLSRSRLELGERSKAYKELAPQRALLKAVAPAIATMCETVKLRRLGARGK